MEAQAFVEKHPLQTENGQVQFRNHHIDVALQRRKPFRQGLNSNETTTAPPYVLRDSGYEIKPAGGCPGARAGTFPMACCRIVFTNWRCHNESTPPWVGARENFGSFRSPDSTLSPAYDLRSGAGLPADLRETAQAGEELPSFFMLAR